MNKKKFQFKFTYNMALFAICIVLFTIFASINPAFIGMSYITETIRMVIEIGIMALPLTLLVVMGSIDFSMASILVLSAALGGIATPFVGGAVGVLITLGVGMSCGALNGTLVARLRLPPLVTTLATMYLFRGITLVITLANPAVGANVTATRAAMMLGSGLIAGIPTQIWIFLILAIVFYLILSKTTYGRTLYAIGLNENATKFSGVHTSRVKHLTYIFAGLIFSIAGLVFMGRFSTIQFNSADPYTMQVITACVLGGCDMRGGRGNVLGTILGVSIIGILKAGMNVILLPQTQQRVVLGIVLLLSLVVYSLISNRSTRVKKPVVSSQDSPEVV